MITNKPIIGHIIPFSRGDGEHRAQNRGFVRVIGPRGGCLGAFFACSARSGPNCSGYRGRGSPATRKIVRVRPRQPGESGFEPGVQRRGITSSLTIVLLRPPRAVLRNNCSSCAGELGSQFLNRLLRVSNV